MVEKQGNALADIRISGKVFESERSDSVRSANKSLYH